MAEAAGFGSANIEDFGLNNSKFPGVISELDGVQLYARRAECTDIMRIAAKKLYFNHFLLQFISLRLNSMLWGFGDN